MGFRVAWRRCLELKGGGEWRHPIRNISLIFLWVVATHHEKEGNLNHLPHLDFSNVTNSSRRGSHLKTKGMKNEKSRITRALNKTHWPDSHTFITKWNICAKWTNRHPLEKSSKLLIFFLKSYLMFQKWNLFLELFYPFLIGQNRIYH